MSEEIERQECGCLTRTCADGVSRYEPCLACALKNAGLMLQQAGLRISEAIEQEQADAAEAAAHAQDLADGFIGGSD